MRRWLVRILAILSLVMGAGIAVAWLRYYEFSWGGVCAGRRFAFSQGSFSYCNYDVAQTTPSAWGRCNYRGAADFIECYDDRDRCPIWHGTAKLPAGFAGIRLYTGFALKEDFSDLRAPKFATIPAQFLDVHIALPVLLSGILPGFVVLERVCKKARVRRRIQRGLCTNCGYDLRASKDCCPERGEAIRRIGS
ncbi:MAG: hypothetical protein ACHRHE_18510 [Tepidisphaerales bacterium]